MTSSMTLQLPHSPERLILLLHGVGASPESMAPLGELLARQFDQAAIISVQAPDASDFGQGFQWFSVQGVTEENRFERILTAMPRFVESVQYWQAQTNVSADKTTLIGFSQGAIMSLSSTQIVDDPLASCIISLSGRLANRPTKAPKNTRIHFLHGDQDPVIDSQFAQQAHAELSKLGADTTFDLIANLVHTINQTEVHFIIRYLQDEIR
ncbi:esterase [Marinomonas spartinae]|uniref:esterase n=1 Tax=Marinomonas spartinae TaxID=1792290 RepID=UPI0018F1BF56|nr:esterase [Marinomonas spartinae]MBJ7556656.1 esterase [Marinomonas spartinae]